VAGRPRHPACRRRPVGAGCAAAPGRRRRPHPRQYPAAAPARHPPLPGCRPRRRVCRAGSWPAGRATSRCLHATGTGSSSSRNCCRTLSTSGTPATWPTPRLSARACRPRAAPRADRNPPPGVGRPSARPRRHRPVAVQVDVRGPRLPNGHGDVAGSRPARALRARTRAWPRISTCTTRCSSLTMVSSSSESTPRPYGASIGCTASERDLRSGWRCEDTVSCRRGAPAGAGSQTKRPRPGAGDGSSGGRVGP